MQTHEVPEDDVPQENFYRTDGGGYLLVWYGMLFAVCEALKGIMVLGVQGDIDSIFDSLKDCRNAVFHMQPKYWSKKLLGFITVTDNVDKVHRVHEGLFLWIKDEMLRRGLAMPADFSSTTAELSVLKGGY